MTEIKNNSDAARKKEANAQTESDHIMEKPGKP